MNSEFQNRRKRTWQELQVDPQQQFYPSPLNSPIPSDKKQVCKPIQSYLQAQTIKKLYQAQIDLARGLIKIPEKQVEFVKCEDCDRLIDIDDKPEHVCTSCQRTVCQYCSIQCLFRNNILECLNCFR